MPTRPGAPTAPCRRLDRIARALAVIALVPWVGLTVAAVHVADDGRWGPFDLWLLALPALLLAGVSCRHALGRALERGEPRRARRAAVALLVLSGLTIAGAAFVVLLILAIERSMAGWLM